MSESFSKFTSDKPSSRKSTYTFSLFNTVLWHIVRSFDVYFRRLASVQNSRTSLSIGSISAAFSSLVYVPPREETAGCVSSKACPWSKFIIKFLRRFWWSEMSSNDNHRRAHMTPMARNICTRAVFTTSPFNFGKRWNESDIYYISKSYAKSYYRLIQEVKI